MAEYRTTEENVHAREEELQWVRILSGGDPARGMALVFIQKLCTAFHEFEPAWREGALGDDCVELFRERLGARIRRVLVTLENNGLDALDGATGLAELLDAVESAQAMGELADLAERVHAVNHALCDSLEAGV